MGGFPPRTPGRRFAGEGPHGPPVVPPRPPTLSLPTPPPPLLPSPVHTPRRAPVHCLAASPPSAPTLKRTPFSSPHPPCAAAATVTTHAPPVARAEGGSRASRAARPVGARPAAASSPAPSSRPSPQSGQPGGDPDPFRPPRWRRARAAPGSWMPAAAREDRYSLGDGRKKLTNNPETDP